MISSEDKVVMDQEIIHKKSYFPSAKERLEKNPAYCIPSFMILESAFNYLRFFSFSIHLMLFEIEDHYHSQHCPFPFSLPEILGIRETNSPRICCDY